jgi:AcrR family transcriptional regulator
MTTTAEHEVGLRERKKRETRDRLRGVALRLAVERGVEHVTVEDIAAEADVSTRTFFNYFGSKEEVLVGPDPSSATDMAQSLADRPADESPLDSVRALMLTRATVVAERADDIRARMRLITSCPALQPRYFATAAAMERVLTEGIAARTGTDPDLDPYPSLLAGVASTVMRTTIISWLAGPGERPLTELIDEAFDHIAAGLPAPAPAHHVRQVRTAPKKRNPR